MRQAEKLTVYYDGGSIEFSPSSNYFWKGQEGMGGLTADIYTAQKAARSGVTVMGTHSAHAPITIIGQINEERAVYEVAREALLRALPPERRVKLVYQNELYTRHNYAIVQASPDPDREIFPEFEVDFFCPSPFWREGDGNTRARTGIANWLPNFEFPEAGLEITEDGFEFEIRAPSLLQNIVNLGDVELPITIVFTASATVSNPKIINVVTQEYMVVEREMLAGDVITVETDDDLLSAKLNRGGVITNVFNDVPDAATWLKLHTKSAENPTGSNYLRATASNDDYISAEIFRDSALYHGV